MTDDRVREDGRAADAASPRGTDAARAEAAPPPPPPEGDFSAEDLREAEWRAWGNLWQVPAIIVSTILILAGLWYAMPGTAEIDYDGRLDQVADDIAGGRLEEARTALQQGIEPELEHLATTHQARFHALVADWISVGQAANEASTPENNQLIDEHYARALEWGLALSPVRLERWGLTLLALGRVDEARQRLRDLEALSATEHEDGILWDRRNRLLRDIVLASLDEAALSFDETMTLLDEFRADGQLTPTDRAWAVVQQARLRMEDGKASEAVDHLLVEMRRLEGVQPSLDESAWGELYVVLARSCFESGRDADATYYVDEALTRLPETDGTRGEALLVQGWINSTRGEFEAAHEQFDQVVQHYESTRAWLPALFGRAEVASILGNHDASLDDYTTLLEELPGTGVIPGARRDVSRDTLAASLADRHDAALTSGRLDLALQYVSRAETLFAGADVPPDVLFRMASTSRQLADDIIGEALEHLVLAGDRPVLERVDPATRHEAAERYARAGAYFLRHARALTATPGADEQWAESLWLSADCYDHAGRRELAIEHFLEYIAGRPIEDARRPQVTFRVAQAYQAQLEYDSAAQYYAQVIDEHPRSVWGTRAHVPLARCYTALTRHGDAERQLLLVIDGNAQLTPDALDYRDALLELGRVYYETERYAEAIERLDIVRQRYPDDARISEIVFRLADSHRRLALQQQQRIDDGTPLTPSRRAELQQQARDHLDLALTYFGDVCEGYGAADPRRLTALQQDYHRHAWLYRGDCAYQLEAYELAATLYDQAARTYSDHYASMHALVQIINCFDRLDDSPRAEVAHRNALLRLSRLPEGAFDDPAAIMDRSAWDEWLRNRPASTAPIAQGQDDSPDP